MAMMVRNNIAAMKSLKNLNANSSKLKKSLEKISSGQKINSASDDASSYSISERMREQLRSLNQDRQNVQNGSSAIRIAEGGVQDIVNVLREMKALAINAANDHNTDEDRQTIQKEFTQRLATINDVAIGTQFNGKRLIDGTYQSRSNYEDVIVGYEKVTRNITLLPTSTYEKEVYIDGKRVVIGENNVKNITRNFTPVDSSIRSTTLLQSYTTPRLTADIGFNADGSTWNWSTAYKTNVLSSESSVTNVFENTDTTHSTAQQVMKAFMKSLNDTSLKGVSALDEAINYATGGTITSKNALVNKFMSDLNGSASYTDFLTNYCDINLTNADTGAITGKDAGGSATDKTKESIVQETVAVTSWGVPTAGSTTTINGLTIHWPTSGASGSLTAAEKHILSGLNSDWINKSLQLIKDSYGIDFTEPDASTKDIYVKFENNNNNALAYVSSQYNTSTGKTVKLDLVVNMKYYSDIDTTSEDGALLSSSSMYYSAGYLDRTIAHEFTHAVMSANIDNFSSLPMYIKEGTAELTHGIDDVRTDRIINLLSTSSGKSKLQTIFTSGGNQGDADPYAAGYVLLRYLAKQGAGQTISRTDTAATYSSATTVPTMKESGIQINFGAATNGASQATVADFNGQGFSILCGGCGQYINIIFDASKNIGQGELKTYSDNRYKKDYTIGINGATSLDDLGKAIFEGIANSSRSSTDTQYDVYVNHTDGTKELVCVNIDATHNLRIAKNPAYDANNPSAASEYIFLKQYSPSLLFLDSGTVLATGGTNSKDDLPQGTVTQTGTSTRPEIQQINVTNPTSAKVWDEDPIIENKLVTRYKNFVVHSGTQAGQYTNYYINNMQTWALTAGKLFDEEDNLLKESDKARYDALSNDAEKQNAWLETLKKAENLTVDDISVTTIENANVAIRVLDGALEYALDNATTLGAYLERLESTETNVTTTEEKVTAAESTIRDADMAKEMTEYTKANVLMQAAQSMLAQANQNSSTVLNLLR